MPAKNPAEYKRKRRAEGKDLQRGAVTKEQARAASKKYRDSHPEKCRVRAAKWRRAHPNKKGKGFAHLRGKVCEICGATKDLCGDHNHATKTFRGTLCRSCNCGLGQFKDDTGLLMKAKSYLENRRCPMLSTL